MGKRVANLGFQWLLTCVAFVLFARLFFNASPVATVAVAVVITLVDLLALPARIRQDRTAGTSSKGR